MGTAVQAAKEHLAGKAPPKQSKVRTLKQLTEPPKVNQELRGLLPELSDEERRKLKNGILADGVRDKIIVWAEENTTVDGHNRQDIASEIRRNKGGYIVDDEGHKTRVDYDPAKHDPEYLFMPFPTVEAVKAWMLDTQDGRRNLTETQRKYYLGVRYKLRVGARGGEMAGRENVAQKLADQHGVTTKTVENAGKFAEALDKIGEANPEARQAILSGASDATAQEVMKIGQQSDAVIERAAEKIASGKEVSDVVESLPEKKPATKPKTKSEVKDRRGKVVPGTLNTVFDDETKDEFTSLENLAKQLSRELGQLAERKPGAKLRKIVDDLQAKAKVIAQEVHDKAPHQLCDKCHGTNAETDDKGEKKTKLENCKRCGGDGFLSREVSEAKD